MKTKLKRGCLINAIFILSIIGSIANILCFFTNKYFAKIDPSLAQDTTTIVVTTIIGVVNLSIFIGAWLWNQICIYAIIPVSLIAAAFSLCNAGITTPTIIGSVIGISINCFFVYSLLKIQKSNISQSLGND